MPALAAEMAAITEALAVMALERPYSSEAQMVEWMCALSLH